MKNHQKIIQNFALSLAICTLISACGGGTTPSGGVSAPAATGAGTTPVNGGSAPTVSVNSTTPTASGTFPVATGNLPVVIANAAPVNVKLVEVSSAKAGELVASWMPASDDTTPVAAIRYELHAAADANFQPSVASKIWEGTGITAARISAGLTPGARYTVRLRAIDLAGLQTTSSPLAIDISSIDAVVNANVKVTNLQEAAVQSVASNQIILQAGVATPQVKEFISSSIGNGFLRQVTAISNQGGATVLTTRFAAVNEVVSDVAISSQFRMVTVPKEITATALQTGLIRASAKAGSDRVEVSWPQSGLRYEAEPSIAAAQFTGNAVTPAATPLQLGLVQGGNSVEQGSWASLSVPSYVQLADGESAQFDVLATITDRSKPLFSEKRKICKINFGAVSSSAADSQPSKISLQAGDFSVTQSENNPYRAIAGSFPITIRAQAGALATKPYKVTVKLLIKQIDEDCNKQTFFSDEVTKEMDIIVTNDAQTFERQIIPGKIFSGSGDFKVTNDIDLIFSPAVKFDYVLSNASLKSAAIQVDAAPRIEQVLKISANAAGTMNQTLDIVPFRKFFKVYMAGSVPVVVSGEYSIKMNITGKATGVINASQTLSIGYDELSYGIEYKNGQYTAINKIKPTFKVSVAGEGKARADLLVTLEPDLKITVYEALSGQVKLKPYLTAEAGIEGLVRLDAAYDFSQGQLNSVSDADYRLTAGKITGGVKVYLGADFKVWDYTLAAWPKEGELQEYDVIPNTAIMGIPDLGAEVVLSKANSRNTRALLVQATATNIGNPFLSLFPNGPTTFLPWRTFTLPKLVPVLGRSESAASLLLAGDDASGGTWVDFREPGQYVIRQGGYSSMGVWARQYVETSVDVTDANNNGIMDYWEQRYGLKGSGSEIAKADPDKDGLTNLQEWQQGTDPLVANNAGIINTDKDNPSVGERIALWVSGAADWVKTVIFDVASAAIGIADRATAVFNTAGQQTVNAGLYDVNGKAGGTLTRVITVGNASITSAEDDRALPATLIANGTNTEDTTPLMRGAVSCPLAFGHTVQVFDGSATEPLGVATVSGAAWQYLPAVALSNGPHTLTVAIVRFDGSAGVRSAPYILSVQSVGVSGVSPTQLTRTVATRLTINGDGLPTSGLSVIAPGSRNTCSAPTAASASSFAVDCSFYTVGQQVLQVWAGNRQLGSATVVVNSNVTDVTWSSASTSGYGKASVKFGEMVTYRVSGVNLLADAVMGFAVERCGVSNTEVGTASNTQRSFQCWFNNEAGAVAGNMSGVVKDSLNGQQLYNFTVPVQTAPLDINASMVVSWDLGSIGTAQTGRGTNPRTVAVNAGVEIEGFLSNPMFDVDVSDTSVRLFNFRGFSGASGVLDASAFNGLVLRVPSGANWQFASASLSASNTVAGLTAARITSQSDRVTINLQSLAYSAGSVVQVDFVKSAVTAAAVGRLPDTGITSNQCYQAGSDILVSCTSAGALALNNQQDGMVGRDVTSPNSADGKLGFSFSTVGSYPLTDCVKDNITGLIWEGKPASGYRAASIGYSNYDNVTNRQFLDGTAYFNLSTGQLNAASNSVGFKNAVNTAGLCGFNDWRLPTADELQSLVDYGVPSPGPTIDADWFPNTVSNPYWSSTPDVSGSPNAWGVFFGSGGGVSISYRSAGLQVRLVRASQ